MKCRKIKNDRGEWEQIEVYISRHWEVGGSSLVHLKKGAAPELDLGLTDKF